MIVVLSYFIAIIITLVIGVLMYPIASVFWIVGVVGKMISGIADFIFRNTNSGIKKLWADIRHTKVVREVNNDVPFVEDNNVIDAEGK